MNDTYVMATIKGDERVHVGAWKGRRAACGARIKLAIITQGAESITCLDCRGRPEAREPIPDSHLYRVWGVVPTRCKDQGHTPSREGRCVYCSALVEPRRPDPGRLAQEVERREARFARTRADAEAEQERSRTNADTILTQTTKVVRVAAGRAEMVPAWWDLIYFVVGYRQRVLMTNDVNPYVVEQRRALWEAGYEAADSDLGVAG